jgi:hypothetical protein
MTPNEDFVEQVFLLMFTDVGGRLMHEDDFSSLHY